MTQERKKVLYISYDSLTEPLSESQVLPYLKGLSGDFDLFLLTFNKEKMSEGDMRSISEKYGIKKIFGLKYHKNPTLPATSYDVLCGIIRTFFITKKFGISFIHARSYIACAIAFALNKISGLPYIFDVRGLLADERVDSGDWKKDSFTYRLVKFLEKSMLKSAKRIVLLSKKGAGVVEDIEKNSKNKTTVIPTCVDTKIFSPKEASIKKGPLKLIYIGSLGTWYMLDEMLEFFKTAKKMKKNAEFLIITQSDPSIAKELIRKKKLDEGSFAIRKESHDKIPGLLEESDASIFFIKPAFSKKLSCPTKFAESLSMGLPVITNSGIGDLDDYLKSYSVGVVIGDFKEKDYENAVAKLSDMLEDRRGLSKKCRDLCTKEFSLESGVQKYREIYDYVCEN